MSFFEVNGLYKTYQTMRWLIRQRSPALNGVSLNIEQGQTVVVLGKNGAGKTTLMNISAGLLLPSAGTVRINGLSPVDLRGSIGYLPEFIYVPEFLSCFDFLWNMGVLAGIDAPVLRRRIPELCERFDLSRFLHTRLGQFSMGNKRRVLFVQSILHDPRLLILDEPTVYLDFLGKEAFYDFLKHMQEKGCAVLMSSHILSDIEKLAERLVLLREGVITHAFNRRELEQKADLEEFIVRLLKS